MPEQKEDRSLVETLRVKTEQDDIRQNLKSIWGGYTKDSVQEYLNVLRRQQQTMAETFSSNQQALFEEKERLKKSNDAIKARLSQVETAYRSLSEAARSHELEDGACSNADIAALKSRTAALEEALDQSSLEKGRLEKQLEQQEGTIRDCTLRLEQSGQEKLGVREMLKAEMLESKKQRSTVLRLTNELEGKNEEIRFLNAMVSDGQLAVLREKVDDLTQQLEAQNEAFSGCNEENSSKSQVIETLTGENEMLRQSIARLTKNVEEVNNQNDKLIFANKSLADQLESEFKRFLALIKEKSYLTTDKLTAVRKLEEANSRLAMLESQLQKHQTAEQIDTVSRSAYRTETVQSGIS